MKKFKELKEELSHKVPVHHKDDYETDEGIKKAFERNHAATKEALAKQGVTKGFKESTWQNYRQEALLMEAALDKVTLSPESVAKKHGVSVATIEAQLQKGIKVEREHTSDTATAREIALDHLGEFPDYYTKLDKANLEEARLHHVLKGHPYHHKSDAELHYIIKDASEAEKAIGSHDKKAMWKYGDQQNDAATVLGYRKRGGKQIPEPKRVDEADLKAQWNQDASKDSYSRRGNLRRTIKQQLVPKTPGLGNRAWLRADKEDKASRPFTHQVHEGAKQLEESVDHLAQFSHHWAQFNLHNNLSDTDRTHLTKRNYHEQEMNKHYKNLTTQQKNALRLSLDEGNQLNELNRSTLKNYVARAASSLATKSAQSTVARKYSDSLKKIPTFFTKGAGIEKAHYEKEADKYQRQAENRTKGIQRAAKKLEEGLTARERLSGAERLKPIEPAPMDHAQDQKKALAHHDNTNDSVRKNLSQGGIDSAAHKTIHHGTASKQMQMHEHFNSVADVAADHGYKFSHNDKGGSYHYIHPSGARVVEIDDPNGRWHHYSDYKKSGHQTTGFEGTNLHAHLSKLHEAYNVAFNESGSEGYKVGDKVVAKIGPHKGTVHTVIHVHPTGHLNIKPNVHVRSNRYHLGAAKADPKDVTRHLGEAKKPVIGAPIWDIKYPEPKEGYRPIKKTGINRKTVQEAFQAAKDKKNGKQDALPADGANEPKQETQAPVPQGQTVTQDGGAPGAQKKNNTPMPEKQGRGKKIDVKGPGVDDKFQSDPIVTPLTTMPDVASPKSGSQGVR